MNTPAVSPSDPDLSRLFGAIFAGDRAAVGELLSRRRELACACGSDGQTPLHAAAQCNDPVLGHIFLACGADPDARYGDSGHTALSWAATCNARDFARALINLRVRPDLFAGAGLGDLQTVHASFDDTGSLIAGASRTGSSRFDASGKRLPCPPASGREQISDALTIACRNGCAEVVRSLLTKSPDLSFRGYMGGTPLHWAYFGGAMEVVDLLVAAGADAAALDDTFRCTPPLFGACTLASWGMLDLLRARVAADPSLAGRSDGRTTPLHAAARGGSAEVIQFLLDHGASRTTLDFQGQTPAQAAESAGRPHLAAILAPGA